MLDFDCNLSSGTCLLSNMCESFSLQLSPLPRACMGGKSSHRTAKSMNDTQRRLTFLIKECASLFPFLYFCQLPFLLSFSPNSEPLPSKEMHIKCVLKMHANVTWEGCIIACLLLYTCITAKVHTLYIMGEFY